MRYRLLLLLACTLLSAQTPHLAESPTVFGLLDHIYSASGERIYLTKGGDPLYFQDSLATPQQNVYQLNFRVDEMDLTKSTFGLADSKLHLFCKPNITCVWRNTFEGPVNNPGKMSRQEKFGALNVNARTAEIANQVLQDLVKLQNLVTFTNPADDAAQLSGALSSLASAPRPTAQATPQPPPAATEHQLAAGKEAFEICEICHDAGHIAELGKNKDLYTPLDGLFRRAKLLNGKPVTNDTVRAVIEDGGRGMPAYKDQMTEEDLTDIVLYLRKRFR